MLIGLYLGLTAVFEILGPHQLVFPRYILDPNVGLQYGPGARTLRGVGGGRSGDVLRRLCLGVRCRSTARQVASGRRPVHGGMCLRHPALAHPVGLDRLCARRSAGLPVGAAAAPAAASADRRRRCRGGRRARPRVQTLQTLVTERAGNQRSVWDRENVNAAALRIIHDRPLSGVGWANYITVSRDWVRQATTYPITHIDIGVHDVFLSRAAELGIPAAMLWTCCLLAGPVRAVLHRSLRDDLRGWQLVLLGSLCGGSCPAW